MTCTRWKESLATLVLGASGRELRWRIDGNSFALGFGERTELHFEASPTVPPGGMEVRIEPHYPERWDVLTLPRQEVVFTFRGEPTPEEVYS